MDLTTSVYLTLNDTATSLWARLVDGASEEALVHQLRSEFDVDEASARSSVTVFLSDLRGRGYLVEEA